MMINKRLIGAVPESKKYIAGNVALQWCSLCANIAMMSAVTELLAALFAGEVTQSKIVTTAVIALAAVAVRYGCTVGASRMGYLSSKAVVLLVCVPLIPVAIEAVQTWAKKLLSKYWGSTRRSATRFLKICRA